MNTRATIRLLPDGRRLYLNDGPIDLIVGADGASEEVARAYQAAASRFVTILDELCEELSLLRTRASNHSPFPKGHIAGRMSDAVSAYQERCFITPMAAVAGAVAEAVLATMTEAAELQRAYVNNGGDIALHVSPGHSYAIGMIERPENPSLFGKFDISFTLPVRGVATSGWRGRSFSLGIADAATVLAASAPAADVAATIVANAVNLPDHPAIARVPAREVSPDSDLLDLPVTRAVGALCVEEIFEALKAGATVAHELQAKGWIHAAAVCLQGQVLLVDPPFDPIGLKSTGILPPVVAREVNNAQSQRRARA